MINDLSGNKTLNKRISSVTEFDKNFINATESLGFVKDTGAF